MTYDTTFFALSDPTRCAIVARLAAGPAGPGELGGPFAISGPAISRHLRILSGAGLIVNERAGKGRICRLTPAPLKEAASWLDAQAAFWEASMDRLAVYLEQEKR